MGNASMDRLGRRPPRWLRTARRLVTPLRPILYRTRPLSVSWGHERGTPIDRFYIDDFVMRHRGDIRGRVLEIRDRRYTDRFGSGVTERAVLDVDPANAAATIIADLADCRVIADDSFDCIILTQTLHYIPAPSAAVDEAHRILKPGGVLLATVPSIIRIDAETPAVDRWRFTEVSCREVFGAPFGHREVEVSSAGNVLAAIAFLTGMAAEEFSPAKLTVRDPSYPVVILVRAVKHDDRLGLPA